MCLFLPSPISSAQESFRLLHRSLLEFDQTSLCPAPCATVDDTKGIPTYQQQEADIATVKIYFRCMLGSRVATSTKGKKKASIALFVIKQQKLPKSCPYWVEN